MSLFGQSTNLFGQAKPAQPTQGPQQQTSIFGQSQPAQQQQPQQQQQQQQQQMGQNPQQNSMFGQTQDNASVFGNSNLGQSMAQNQQPQQMPALSQSQAQLNSSYWQPAQDPPHQKPMIDQMKYLWDRWNENDPNCVFKYYFYNKVDEANVPFYKPQPGENPIEWEEALQNKPAAGFMPVLCTGFASAADRLRTQSKAISEFNKRMHMINSSLDAILQRHELETDVRALAARRRQATIAQRLVSLASRAQILRNRGYALSGDEDDLKGRLQQLEKEVLDPAVSAREEDLWSKLIVLREYADQLNKEMDKPASGEGELDQDTEAKAKRILEDYEKQIQHLKKELETLNQVYTEWETSRDANSR